MKMEAAGSVLQINMLKDIQVKDTMVVVKL
jgi:hypothetical protein